jgi:hypothetical protein
MEKTLLVMENPGDLSQLVESKTIDEPENSLFAFQNQLSNLTAAKWEVSLNSSFVPLLGSDAFEPSAQGKGKIIPVDWKKFVHDTPLAGTKYYFRVASYRGRTVATSNTVVITVKRATSMVKFRPEMGVTVRTKFPDVFAASPMPIEINLTELQIAKSNENSDEPYLLVAVVYADGTTINPLAPSASTVRVDPPRKAVDQHVGGVTIPDVVFRGPPRKTHGNVALKDENGDDLADWSIAKISPEIGHFEKTITPIGLELVANMEDPFGKLGDSVIEGTAVYVIVVAMEKDNTSTEAIDKAYDTMILELTNQLNGVLRGTTPQELQSGNINFDPTKITDELTNKVIARAKDATLTDLWWLPPIFFGKLPELIDPDDFIGFAFAKFTFGQLLRAGKDGITFALTCERKTDYSGTYNVFGNIRQK